MSGALLKEPDPGIGERDQQTGVWVDVNVLRVVAAIANKACLGVVYVGSEWAHPVLARQPGSLVGEVIDAEQIGADLPGHCIRAVAEGPEHELRDIRPGHIACRKPAEQSLRGDAAVEFRSREGPQLR